MIEEKGMLIATSRYQSKDLIVHSGLAPVRITVGAPRFPLRYELAGSIPALAPHRSWFGKPDFEDRYRAKLDQAGVDAIQDAFNVLASDRGVVLLCFEDVHKGESCHRRHFARWWLEQTGEEVPELETPQLGLF